MKGWVDRWLDQRNATDDKFPVVYSLGRSITRQNKTSHWNSGDKILPILNSSAELTVTLKHELYFTGSI